MKLQFRWVFDRQEHQLADELPVRTEREFIVQEWEVENMDDAPAEAAFMRWWIDTAISDFQKTVPKMLEYGGTGPATDLLIIGASLAELLDMHDAPDAVKLELGCWFYLQGKVARLVTNYKHGDPGKPDTWFDANIYTMMARRIQETGRWP